ncbi:MAG TPA: right-handed parallel beta-helix repeat-containing protein [Opitutaceae bacterium]|nr:right-handed parallel beta-helix repeat-containing protein [Opitutaceae bacterium]
MSLLRLLVTTSLLVAAARPVSAESAITNTLAAPSVTTGAAAADSTSAVVSGSVTSENGLAVTARGFVYNTAGDPKLESDPTVIAGSGTGFFSATLPELAEGTTYQIRAFATNEVGTAYGAEISLSTAAPVVSRAEVAAAVVALVVTNPSSVVYSPTAVAIRGTAATGATVNVAIDGGTAKKATNTAGAWTITPENPLEVGDHTIVVTDGTTSVTLQQSVFAPTGFGASASGGSYGTEVTATTRDEFIEFAKSPSAYVINVSGTLALGTDPVAVAANKTIQGVDAHSGLDGCLSLSTVGNVIIRGLNLANSTGPALKVTNTQQLFVTHCTFLNSSPEQVDISYSDLITFSWCEFASNASGQVAMKVGREGGTDTPRLTLHHNWWSNNLASGMPAAASGYVHQYSNYINTPGNTAGTALSGATELLTERNHFEHVANPLTKTGTAKIRGSSSNLYTDCTGTAAPGEDTVFIPGYSYHMDATAQLATVVPHLAGNTAGADSDEPDVGSATITIPSTATTAVTSGTSITLTAAPKGVTASTYEWRLANQPIAGATASTYTISSMSSSTAGKYTVAIGVADGSTVVSVPLTLTVATPTNNNSGGGGGAFGLVFPAVLVLLALRRRRA